MKLNKIKALCRERKMVTLYNEVGPGGELLRQWISDGVGIYRLVGLPVIGTEHLGTLLGLSDKQALDTKMDSQTLPGIYSTEEGLPGDAAILEEMGMALILNGRTMIPFCLGSSVLLTDEAHLAPILTPESLFRLVYDENGWPHVAVYNGLFLAGIVAVTSPKTSPRVQGRHWKKSSRRAHSRRRKMRSDYNLDAHQATHYFRCCLCGKAWYDSLIRQCPEREERKVCMYCCRLCSRSARSGSGLECRAAPGRKKAG